MARYFKIFIFFSLFFITLSLIDRSKAAYDPVSVPNNKFGIHILFPDEILSAKKLVNSQGGDWGYVTIPIQSSDKDLIKWQKFMDDAKDLHIIPIIRLSTTGDYFNTSVWEKPKLTDIVDFANFLDSLNWPTKNRYVVIYNEVNRGNEWGGSPDPFEYAQILDFAVDTFKSKNPDFFVVSAGLDNAAPNIFGQYMNEYDFMRAMSYEVPDIFERIDGIASHSYPNPDFSQSAQGWGVYSFRSEENLAKDLGSKNLPIFITETGWDDTKVNPNLIASYYKDAFENAWNDKNVIAVTPFLLEAGSEPFSKFSFISKDGKETPQYEELTQFSKVNGDPQIASEEAVQSQKSSVLPSLSFNRPKNKDILERETKKMAIIFKWLLGI